MAPPSLRELLEGACGDRPRCGTAAERRSAGHLMAAVPTWISELLDLHFLHAVGALADQGEEFGAGFFGVAEAAQHRAGNGRGVLLFYAAHHHAEMARFDDHAHALRFDDLLDGLGDLRGEALLNLEAAREKFDEARNLAESNHAALGDVGDVHLAEKWQQMVLAQTEHLDVFDDHHLIVADGEQSSLEESLGIFA